jgi:diadenosine tetraphosphate (Ap4A) HIT family hydrolase
VREWPADWDERKRGKDCPMCAEGRPEDNGFGPRIFTGRCSDAYLQRRDVGQPGYTVAIWRGRHVADPTELTDDEARIYFAEVLRVGRAIDAHYHPLKLNFDILGNTVPHLHTHILPRYADDGAAMVPARLMRGEVSGDRQMPKDVIDRDAAALRDLLR